jgi:RND family efflux transporter MFP subunit
MNMSACFQRANLRSIVLGVLGSLSMACVEEPPPLTETVRAVRTTIVAEPASGRLRRFSGVVEAADSSSISFEVSGIVAALEVDVGDRISAGQVLASIEDGAYRLNVKAAEASVRRAEVEFQDASNEFERFAEMNRINSQVISARALERSKALRDSARQGFSYASARLNLAQRDLERTVLHSPFAGVIAQRHVDAHQQVSRGEMIFDLFVEGVMEAAISVPETEISQVHLGLPGEVRFPGIDEQRYPGFVTEISEVARAANAFPVRVAIDTENSRIRPGVTAEVSLLLGEDSGERAYLIPLGALAARSGQDGSQVFRFDPATSTVRMTPIESGDIRGDGVVVNSGLNAGDIIVTAGVSFLRDGQQVRLMQR